MHTPELTRDDLIRIEGALTVSARKCDRDAKSRRYTGPAYAPTRAMYRSEAREQRELAGKVRRIIDAAY